MNTSHVALLLTICLVGLNAQPASAISADLAKKCRAMAFKAYPPPLTGAKSGNAAKMRGYYSECLAKDGAMPEPAPATKPESVVPPPK